MEFETKGFRFGVIFTVLMMSMLLLGIFLMWAVDNLDSRPEIITVEKVIEKEKLVDTEITIRQTPTGDFVVQPITEGLK